MGQPLPLYEIAAISLNYLVSQRRRLGLWLIPAGYSLSSAILYLDAEKHLRLIDLLAELCGQLRDDADKPLGVFDQDDLARWIRHQSYLPPSCPLIIYDIEPLLATFGKPGTIGFFRLVSQLDSRWPVVLISHLADLVGAAGFPGDRIWYVSSQEGKWKR